jgi:spore coat protein A, manganese oxidase
MSDSATTPGKANGMRRRAFLAGGAGALLAAGAPGFLRAGGGSAPALARAARARGFRRALPIPRVLTGTEAPDGSADIRIPMRRARVRLLPGAKTRMWTYDGTFPGPTIRRPAGKETRVTFVHQLGSQAGELTVHLHGGHNTSADDGQPGGLTAAQPRSLYCDISPRLGDAEAGNDLLIAPGEERTYTYGLTEAGEPERASFQWYHDHRLDNTARNVWRGLAGMWILDDDVDRPGGPLGLPEGRFDVPLMLTDRSFKPDNQLTNPFRGLRPPNDGVTGDRVLVNGAHRPHLSVQPRRYRLRLLNASSFRAYNLALSNGAKLTQIATEAGLMPVPVKRRRILLGPGERVEVVIDFARLRGRRVRLESVARTDGESSLGSRPFRGALMEFRVGGTAVADPSRVPAELRPLPEWTAGLAESPPAKDFTWNVTVGGGISPRWLINGETFSPDRILTQAEAGQVVVWELRNSTAVAHMMHLHHTDWYLLRRNGRIPPPWERCLKETFFMDPHDRLLVAGRPSDPETHLGKYVVHCHMLDHEDHGLMSQFEVVAPG